VPKLEVNGSPKVAEKCSCNGSEADKSGSRAKNEAKEAGGGCVD
jgi:hypothetical protein